MTKALILGLTLGLTSLIGCAAPPPAEEHAGSPGVATPADPSSVDEVMVVYQPTQLCPSPRACLKGDELAWVPTGTTLAVVERGVEELPRSNVYWFRVEYEERAGWISEMATDRAPRVRGGKVVRE